MIATDFPQTNHTFGKPGNMTDEQCGALRVFMGLEPLGTPDDLYPVIVSAWQPTDEDRARIAAGGPVFLHITGMSMPPVRLSTEPDFSRPQNTPEQIKRDRAQKYNALQPTFTEGTIRDVIGSMGGSVPLDEIPILINAAQSHPDNKPFTHVRAHDNRLYGESVGGVEDITIDWPEFMSMKVKIGNLSTATNGTI